MNTPNEDSPKQLDTNSCCGSGCCCQGGCCGSSKLRWIICIIVLAAAAAMVVRAITRPKTDAPQSSAPGIVTTLAKAAGTNSAATGSVGTLITALSELSPAASATDAAFILVPRKDEGTNASAETISNAARILEGRGIKCVLFTLKPGTPDYEQLAQQLSVPAVLAMAKGRGISTVSEPITETKLVQGYVAASSAGGCGANAGPGCCPK